MLTSVHLVTGAAIGKAMGNLWLTIPISFLSHYILDALPHFNLEVAKNIIEKGLKGVSKKDLILKGIEPILGLILVFYFAFFLREDLMIPILIGAFFADLPDFLLLIKLKYKVELRPKILQELHSFFHPHSSFVAGIIIQIIIFVVLIVYMFL